MQLQPVVRQFTQVLTLLAPWTPVNFSGIAVSALGGDTQGRTSSSTMFKAIFV
jgi:hypothetical protein